MDKVDKARLDFICNDAFAKLEDMRDRMGALGLYMGPRREPYQSRQAPLFMGGPEAPKPKGKGPTPLSVLSPVGPSLRPSGGNKVKAYQS